MKNNKILKWWFGKNIPLVHIKNNGGFKKNIADYIVHPIKRRVAKIYVFILQKLFGLVVIGITGSSGKTTTKEMIASILKLEGKTIWSKENIDPIFNIPATILKCNPFTKYLILEMGVEYPNEMDFYMWLVRPEIGVITNIFPTHTLYFGDQDGVLSEKSKLVKRSKISVLNADDKYLLKLKFTLKAKEYWFNSSKDPIESNANAARKVAEILSISKDKIEAGIKEYKNPDHRLKIIKHKSGAVILDDTYNSNPEALLAALNYFKSISGDHKKVAVIGDMLELGKIEVQEHIRVGKEIKKYKFEKIFGVGKLVKNVTSNVYGSALEVLPHLKKYLKPNFYIFLKASRSIGLDKLVDTL